MSRAIEHWQVLFVSDLEKFAAAELLNRRA